MMKLYVSGKENNDLLGELYGNLVTDSNAVVYGQ